MIERDIKKLIISKISDKKAIVILGARQTGKTTLIENLLSDSEYLLIDCDDPVNQNLLENANTETLKRIIGSHNTVFIDEAQRVNNIGLLIKIIIDHIRHIKIFVSGSSSLDISNFVNEPLTGRKWEYYLYPLSWNELLNHYGFLTMLRQLETRLIYGNYPEVVTHPGQAEEIIKQLSISYLYKDILQFGGIRKPDILSKLLKLLAFQVGSEVSLNELAGKLQIDKKTVDTYIQLLEKAFIIFRLSSFGKNPRKEITTLRKIYFYDNGIRNAIISNFNSLDLRQDTGILWENFMISERVKFLHYNSRSANIYFWRNKQGNEIDLIEERGGKIYAFEFKYSPLKAPKVPKLFKETYHPEYKVVNHENFMDFLTNPSGT